MPMKYKTEGLTSIEVYELILKGEIKQFPKGFWKNISDLELRELLIYFFEKKLHWTIDDIKNKVDSCIFRKNKLGGGMFQDIFDGSPFKVVNFAYPNKINEWELGSTPLSYWTMDKCIEVTKYILEKEKWTDENIKNKPIYELFVKYRVTTIYLTFFNGNSYELINTIYPNKFKPWELPYAPKNYWNKETGKEAVKWIIEKEKWTDKDIKENYKYSIFEKHKLSNMLNLVFECSPFKAINETYPGKFTEEDFNNVPMNYWTKEKAIESIKSVLDKLSEDDIKKYVSVKFFIENGLRYPFLTFFSGRPFLVLSTIYPNKFNNKDFDIRSKINETI